MKMEESTGLRPGAGTRHNPYLISPETLPCFRCGGQIEILVPPPENVPYYGWWCTKCGIRAPRYDFQTLEAAISDANRRAPTPSPASRSGEAAEGSP
jgi:hypothetical protein